MGINKTGDDIDDLAAMLEDDIGFLDRASQTMASVTGASESSKEGRGFVPVTEENLSHLAPGCFVQFGCGGVSCWVEISRIEGDTISGRLHHKLSNAACLVRHERDEVTSFGRDQITSLGCDRYCWC